MRTLVLALAVLAGGCGKGGGEPTGGDSAPGGTDGGATDSAPPGNTDPAIRIEQPGEGEVLPSGVALTLSASITDAESTPEELSVAWTSSVDGTLSGAASLDGERSSLELSEGLSAGLHTLTASVSDPDGGRGEDKVAFEVVDNAPPILGFEVPEDDEVYAPGTELTAVLLVSDDFDSPEQIALSWSGDLGSATPPEAPGADGRATFELGVLDIGGYAITVIGLDTAGASSATTVVFSIAEPEGGDTGDTGG